MPISERDLSDSALTPLALPLPGTDVGNSPATAGRLPMGTSVYGSIGTAGDDDWYAVTLTAGQSYSFRLLGVGQTPVADTYLRLYSSAGTLITSNDDARGDIGNNSLITFTAGSSGTFYLSARAYSTAGTGDFLLTAVPGNPAGVVATYDEIAWQLTNNYERWADGSSANVPATAYDVSGARQITYNTVGLTAEGAALATAALRMWADITGIRFVATTGTAQITFDDSDTDTDAYNSNTTLPDGTITSSLVMVTTGWLAEFGTTRNSYSFETYIHEIGHALGLGHGGNYNGSAEYGIDNYYLNDSLQYSIMSYMQARNDEFSRGNPPGSYNDFGDASFRWMLTPMVADIIAMRNLYGLSGTTRTGDTTYGYNSNTGNASLDAAVTLNDAANSNYVAFTVFDNGGNDTIDMSGFGGAQRINLNQGAYSNVLGGTSNMGIAIGTVIENARGGSAADVLIGNAAANNMTGNAGGDQLFGNAGRDTLGGGRGTDRLDGGAGQDFLTGGADSDSFVFSARPGTANADRITDYNPAQDRIQLAASAFQGLAQGALAARAFVANLSGTAADAADRIIYETDTGALYFDADGTAAGAARQLFATLAAGLTMTAGEFFVF